MRRVTRRISAILAAIARRRLGRDDGQQTKVASTLGGPDHMDLLTGVANRNHFHHRLDEMLQRPAGGEVLLTKCDISRLHDINTSFGYDAGDALLIQVGQRLGRLSGAAIGRLSGDEFAVALPLAGPDLSREILLQIQDLLAGKFVLPGAVIDVRFSIGYAVGKAGDATIGLLRKAGIALHESKRSPFLDPIEFDRQAAIRIESRVRLTSDLQHALEHGEFSMHYQAKIELATGRLIGAEALLRWEHPAYGAQPPDRFIPISEDSGLIVEIGAWALRDVASFAVRVNRGRPDPLTFAVNVSQLQFRRHDIAALLRTILAETQADPSWLMLELTETLLADNAPAMIGALQELRAMGVGLSVDDFGTGYSSLSRLDVFPVTEFKIDRSFITDVHQNRSKQVIVEAMIRLGEALHIDVVAEGIETEAEVSVLRKLGCRHAQGYFFGHPIPEAAFMRRLHGQ